MRPGQRAIQTDLFDDYRTNLESHLRGQARLREHRPPMLVTWGRYDPLFAVQGAHACQYDVPDIDVHLLDAGHFALEEASDEIAALNEGAWQAGYRDAGAETILQLRRAQRSQSYSPPFIETEEKAA